MFKIVNSYEDVDRNIFLKLKEGSRTRGHKDLTRFAIQAKSPDGKWTRKPLAYRESNKAALVMEQCRLDMRKYTFSQRMINEWNKLQNDCVNASSVNMFKNRIDRYMKTAGYT